MYSYSRITDKQTDMGVNENRTVDCISEVNFGERQNSLKHAT